MKEISLHILDIAQNSISAGASRIQIIIDEQIKNNLLKIVIEDNGHGIEKGLLEKITDPFTTTRTTRKVGLGIPLFKEAAEEAGGYFSIKSQAGVGTIVEAVFRYHHIDRQPLGDMAQTMAILILGNSKIDFIYLHKREDSEFTLETTQIRKILGDTVSLDNIDVITWIKDFIKEGLCKIGAHEL